MTNSKNTSPRKRQIGEAPPSRQSQHRRNFAANLKDGFTLLLRRQIIRDEIAVSGPDLLIGVIGALIAKGTNDVESIRQTITEIGGEHLDIPTQEILQEYAGDDPKVHLWHDHFAGGGFVLHR